MDKTYGPELLVTYTGPCDDEVVSASIGIHRVDGDDCPTLGVMVRHCGELVTHYTVPWTVFDPSPDAELTDAVKEAAAAAVSAYMRAVEVFARTAIEHPRRCANLFTAGDMAATLFQWYPEDERFVERFVRNAIHEMKYEVNHAETAHDDDDDDEHSD